MNLPTLAGFLIGRPQAILAVAMDRRTPWIGAFLVLIAAIAREYDGESLLHEPWHLLRPLAFSTVSASVLFWMLFPTAQWRRIPGEDPPMPRARRGYVMFLGLFWMTAPLAWLYAIPYESFMGELDAVRANLWTLALVAAWRVALMVRIVTVVFGTPRWATIAMVLAFADVVAFIALVMAPTPVIDVMGGLRQSERDRLISSINFLAQVLTLISMPVWLIFAGFALPRFRPWWRVQTYDESRPLGWISAVVIILVCAGLLAWGQPAQARRERIERTWASGDFASAYAQLSARTPADYPHHWQPPPARARSWRDAQLLGAMDALASADAAPWVKEAYLRKFDVAVRLRFSSWPDDWETITDAAFTDRIDRGEAKASGLPAMLDFLLREGRPIYDSEHRQLIRQVRDAIR